MTVAENYRISAIAALGARTRALGKNNQLLWKVPGDFARMKRISLNHPIIMGSKTFESIGRILPDRTNIIITRNPEFTFPGIVIAHSLEQALEQSQDAPGSEEIFIFGGGQIYEQAFEYIDRLYLTLVYDDTLGDTFFPEYESEFTTIIEREEHFDHDPEFLFVTLER